MSRDKRIVAVLAIAALIGFWTLVDMVSWFVVMVTTYTVVASDGLIQAMAETEVRASEIRSSEAWQADSAPIAEAAALLGPIGFLAPEPEAKETEDA